MVHQDIYSEPVIRTYRTPSCSWAAFYSKIATILTYFLPLLTIFLTQGLWKKTGTFREVPRVTFNADFIAFGYGQSGSIMASSYSVLNSAASPNQLATARISHHYETGTGENNKEKTLHLDFEMTTQNMSIEVLNYAFLLRFQLDYHCLVNAELLLHDEFQVSNSPSSHMILNARLDIDQSIPLKQVENWKSIDRDRQDVNHYQIFNVLERELHAPFALTMKRKSSINVSNTVNPATFVISLRLLISEMEFTYKTTFWELIKWFWIQYLAVYFIFSRLINSLTSYLFQNRIFNVYVNEQYVKIK